ncbi:hypothetical protein C2E31_21415 [Rhodopirellula baltica]|nr:hypothetical protein C2E31_21415 [Rhodopirellula baltica]
MQRIVRGVPTTTVCSSPLTTSLLDRHCEGEQALHQQSALLAADVCSVWGNASKSNVASRHYATACDAPAESTAHQSNRDIKSDHQETEVP